MIVLEKSRIDRTVPAVIDATATVVEEGQCLVLDNDNGEGTVKPSTGTTGTFYGIAAFEYRNPVRLAKYFTFVSTGAANTATGTLPEGSRYISGTARVTVGTTHVSEGTTGNSFDITSAGVIGFNNDTAAGSANDVVTVQYSVTPTVTEIMELVGDPVHRSAINSGYDAQVGCITSGLIFLTNFDTTKNWAVGDTLHTEAGGIVSKGGTSNIDGFVHTIPKWSTDTFPCLGIELRNS